MYDRHYRRWQEDRIKQALDSRRVLLLVGARQCGKTTLAKELARPGTIYHTLDDATLLEAAKNDPRGFVRHGEELMIIDEVQKAPELLPAVKQDVDEQQMPGRFLLTGSANIQSLPSVQESLAGRVRKIRLRPLAQGEIFGSDASFIKNAFAGNFYTYSDVPGVERQDKDYYLSLALMGGYPEVLRFKDTKIRREWHGDYQGYRI